MSPEIIPFDIKYAKDFYELNVSWLEKFFYVEPYDEKVLSNPKEYIIDNGGYIFFIKLDSKIIGTAAFINQKSYFELSKMAVTQEYQGLQLGKKLIKHCISFAKEKKWNSITLYSHRKLETAINLYKKVGFIEIPLEKDVHYERANIKMKLDL
ncbi:GNAT family N-acetyltransferase [uncultured Polaribacter sp.]|uniref:GNAT family N-acetyltransferase n=1 Tax=uncultured Polaribacter sp. TaxID=174711 RepID=UPI002604CD88|nr:GNAT family N-acetyltransferase [uncultured Polaribacter sp.]